MGEGASTRRRRRQIGNELANTLIATVDVLVGALERNRRLQLLVAVTMAVVVASLIISGAGDVGATT